MHRIKQLARTAVYWLNIDTDVEVCRSWASCCEHKNAPAKLPNHPWILREKPRSRLHVNHTINFVGQNWLVVVDAYFRHFEYPRTTVSDNDPCFTSDEFQTYCKDRNITDLTGSPYHPARNGAAERLI